MSGKVSKSYNQGQLVLFPSSAEEKIAQDSPSLNNRMTTHSMHKSLYRKIICGCIICISFLLLSITRLYSQEISLDSILTVLDREIDNREFYYQKKESQLASLKKQLNRIDEARMKYGICIELFDQYIFYQYDSACYYANQAKNLAVSIKDKQLNIKADYSLLYCYISTGLFKEAHELMTNIDISDSPDQLKIDYYELCMRLYSDMSSYNAGTPFEKIYNEKIILYCDTALLYTQPQTYQYEWIKAFKLRGQEHHRNKIELYHHILQTYDISSHDKAVIYSILGRLYSGRNETKKGACYMALSAIEDIKSSTRETTAKKELAEYLFSEGRVVKASQYIRMALEEATAYNTRHRKMEINSVLPIVEKQRMEIIEAQKKEITLTLGIVSLLAILLISALVVIYKQIHKLEKAKVSIQQQYTEIIGINKKLKEYNEIKDQYIFQSLYGKSDYLERVETLLKKQERRIRARQYDDFLELYKEFNIKTERENMFSSFDEAFLKLFPNFVEEYNKLFKKEDRITLENDSTLTPELRIFALIRLEVTENERIAKFLNLSINTIYVYKAKVKSRTIVPKEEFEELVKRIAKT
jgi:hypothetical protein